jgi:hypothetical protein
MARLQYHEILRATRRASGVQTCPPKLSACRRKSEPNPAVVSELALALLEISRYLPHFRSPCGAPSDRNIVGAFSKSFDMILTTFAIR